MRHSTDTPYRTMQMENEVKWNEMQSKEIIENEMKIKLKMAKHVDKKPLKPYGTVFSVYV